VQFSKRSEYGVRVLTELAMHHGQGPISLAEIARAEEMPLAFLEQIVASLRRAGLVTSHHGVHGGYELSRPPHQIVMSEVLDVLEGTVAPMVCAPLDGSTMLCARESICGSKILWRRVRDAIAETLRTTTLADLVPAPAPRPRPRPDFTPLPVVREARPPRREAAGATLAPARPAT
jgi:Rrf2 family cysteine metabolism transcriptional repressor